MADILKIKDEATQSWITIPAIQGGKGDKGDAGTCGIWTESTQPTDPAQYPVWFPPVAAVDNLNQLIEDTIRAVVGQAAFTGKSAYQTAVEAGYTGTEAEFGAQLANLVTAADVDDKIQDAIALESREW